MSKSKLFLSVLVLAALAACTVTFNVIRDSENVDISHSSDTHLSADSASVNIKLK